DVEERADIRMRELGDGARLALQALAHFLVVALGQDFDGDRALQADIARAVYLAHAAHTRGGEDLIRTELGAYLQAHWGSIIAGESPGTEIETNAPGLRLMGLGTFYTSQRTFPCPLWPAMRFSAWHWTPCAPTSCARS